MIRALVISVFALLNTPIGAETPPAGDGATESYAPRRTAGAAPMRVEVLSGTSFADVETRQVYRLYGIDACDPTQTATLGRQTWPCGTVATAWLVSSTLNKWVACTTIRSQDAVRVARCATGESSDLAAEMLKTGHAVTLPGADDRLIAGYAQLEKDARTAYRGLWASSFQMPWRFRQQHAAGVEVR